MKPGGRECLPLDQVVNTVMKVERDVIGFYEAASRNTRDDEVKNTFSLLLAEKQQKEPEINRVCASLACGSSQLEHATQADLDFLSALAETAFYRQSGSPADMADPSLQTSHYVDNALKLEKDLMLFHMKFYSVSCAAHKPVFSSLIAVSQRHIGELANIKARLARGL
jgi:hypothetical protein